MSETTYRRKTRESEDDVWRNALRSYIRTEIEPGKVYDTVINGRDVGKTLLTLVGRDGRFKHSVAFVEDGMITSYEFDHYDVKDGKLILDNASWRWLSDTESGMIAREMKRNGLLKHE